MWSTTELGNIVSVCLSGSGRNTREIGATGDTSEAVVSLRHTVLQLRLVLRQGFTMYPMLPTIPQIQGVYKLMP